MGQRYMNPPVGAPGTVRNGDGTADVPVIASDGDLSQPAHGGVDSRRVAVVRMTGEVLVHLLTEGTTIPAAAAGRKQARHLHVRRGVPAGAVLLAAKLDQFTNVHEFLFAHDCFEPVPDGRLPPVLPVEYDLVYDTTLGPG